MMVAMSPKTLFGFCAVLAILAAGTAALSELNQASGSTSVIWIMISRFVVVMAFGTFGLYAAQGSNLRGSVAATAEDAQSAFQDMINWGILPGLVLGVLNYLFFFRYRYSPFVAPRIRDMENFYDAFLLSLDSGLIEEAFFRLFVLSSMLFMFQHLYQKIKTIWPTLVFVLPRAMALVLSSLLFALAHNIYGFTAAFCGGLILGFIYLGGGIESSIAAHFAANFLFYTMSYVLPEILG